MRKRIAVVAVSALATATTILFVACAGDQRLGVPNNGGGPADIQQWPNQLIPPSDLLHPGDVIAIWSGRPPSVVCHGQMFFDGGMPRTSDPQTINFEGGSTEQRAAELNLTVKNVITVGGGSTALKSIIVQPGTFAAIYLSDDDYTKKMDDSAECISYVKRFCSTYQGAKYFYSVQGVLQESYDYTVTDQYEAGASVDPASVLEKILNDSGAHVEAQGSRSVHVSSAKATTRFQSLLLKNLRCD